MNLPVLNKALVTSPDFKKRTDVVTPDLSVFSLPEKVLQFGSGGFLRGFADYFIDKANREGTFGGRVVVVQSTGRGRSNVLEEQDGLYTLRVQGLREGNVVEETLIVSSISRAVSAGESWSEVLDCAKNPDLSVIISNTTEVGVRFDEGDLLEMNPPRSFPGKLTAFLHARFQTFDGAPEKGFVIIPCELIENNGDVLLQIVVTLSQRWGLGEAFIQWVRQSNRFCNSLVDRIVPGMPPEEEMQTWRSRLGYEDGLFTIAEVYRLWAIEGDDELRAALGFTASDEGIIVAPDITPYRERKVKILNGTHTISVPAAFLSGNDTVLEMMNHPVISEFVRTVMQEDIVPSLGVDTASARAFAAEVLDRFSNPFLRHELIQITFQHTSKMRHRIVPTILGYYEKNRQLPQRLCFGFACYLLFMRGVENRNGKIYGKRGETPYPINDDHAELFFTRWQEVDANSEESLREFVAGITSDESLWGTDLTALPGFVEAVAEFLSVALNEGIDQSLELARVVS